MKYIKGGVVYSNISKIVLNGQVIFNPTHEQILAAGYAVYVEPNEEKLRKAKDAKTADIESYDASENVNSFSYGGVSLWIDKATRVGLVNAADAAIAVGKDAIEVGLDGVFVTLAPAALKGMLYQLEMYALDCFNVTEKHKAEVAELTTIAEVEAYDITQGYPEKLVF